MPVPLMNILNGGAHADNSVDIQEFMVVPIGGATFSQTLRIGVEIFHHLGRTLQRRGLSTTVGDEGGFAPNLASDEDALRVILESIESAGYQAGRDALLALDVAATELWDEPSGTYLFRKSKRPALDSAGLIDLYSEWCDRYPICSIEDGAGRGRLGGLASLDAETRIEGTAGGRRPVRDQPLPVEARNQGRRRQLNTSQVESDWDSHRDPESH